MSGAPSGMARWHALFVKYGALYGVDARLLEAICYAESGGDPNARGSANANGTRDLGLMQLNPKGALDAWYSNGKPNRDPMNPEHAVEVAAWYLGRSVPVVLKRLGLPVTFDTLVISYNAGPGGARPGRTPSSTLAYLAKVHKRYAASSFAPEATGTVGPGAVSATGGERSGATRSGLLASGALVVTVLLAALRALRGP